MEASVLSVRVESHIKQSFIELCEELGLTASAAVNMFMRQMLREQALPFRPSLPSAGSGACKIPGAIGFIAQTVKGIAAEYSQITQVILFGSFARGEAGPDSDIDLRVVYDEMSDFGLLGMASFSAAVEQALGRPVDVVSAQALDEDLAASIERDGVVLYERA